MTESSHRLIADNDEEAEEFHPTVRAAPGSPAEGNMADWEIQITRHRGEGIEHFKGREYAMQDIINEEPLVPDWTLEGVFGFSHADELTARKIIHQELHSNFRNAVAHIRESRALFPDSDLFSGSDIDAIVFLKDYQPPKTERIKEKKGGLFSRKKKKSDDEKEELADSEKPVKEKKEKKDKKGKDKSPAVTPRGGSEGEVERPAKDKKEKKDKKSKDKSPAATPRDGSEPDEDEPKQKGGFFSMLTSRKTKDKVDKGDKLEKVDKPDESAVKQNTTQPEMQEIGRAGDGVPATSNLVDNDADEPREKPQGLFGKIFGRK